MVFTPGLTMRLREYAVHADDAYIMRQYVDADENLIHIYPHTEAQCKFYFEPPVVIQLVYGPSGSEELKIKTKMGKRSVFFF